MLPSGLDNWKMVVHNLDHLHRGFAELKQSIHWFWLNVTQMQTPATTPTPDTPVPMEIDQSRFRPKAHTCYNCGDKGHLSDICLKPWKQRIWLTESTETDIKSLIAEAVMAVTDARDLAKRAKKADKAEQAKESGNAEGDFRPVFLYYYMLMLL